MSLGMPTEKSMNFWPSVRRLLGHFRAERLRMAVVLGMALASVALSMVGPLLIGHATDLIFAGAISQHLPAGSTAGQAVAAARPAATLSCRQMGYSVIRTFEPECFSSCHCSSGVSL